MYILLLDSLVNIPVWSRKGFSSELLNIEEGAASFVSTEESLFHIEGMCADHLHLVVMSRAVWSTGCHGTCLLWKTPVLMHLRRNEHWNDYIFWYLKRQRVMNIRTVKQETFWRFQSHFLHVTSLHHHVFMSESLNHSFKWFVKTLIHSITKQVNKLNLEPHTTLTIPAIEIHSKMVRTSMRLRIHQVIRCV